MIGTASTKEAQKIDLGSCMQNRELSWLKFNKRVLEEAGFKDNPPFERLKFISIFSSNLDEFFMIRVGSLTDLMLFAPKYVDNKTGMTAGQQLDSIFRKCASLYELRDRYYRSVMEELAPNGVVHLKIDELDAAEIKSIEKYFTRNIMPVLSPQIIDNRHPFPHIDNKLLNIAVTLENKNKSLFGLIAVPKTLDRLFFLEDGCRYVLLEDIIFYFSHLAFKPYKVLSKTVLAVTRNADINIEEDGIIDESVDYRQLMQKLLKKRHRLTPVRLELQYDMARDFRVFFCEKLNVKEDQVFLSHAPLDMSYCFDLGNKIGLLGLSHLFMAPHLPFDAFQAYKKPGLAKYIQTKDYLLSYPFDSISPFLEMMKQAADDQAVISIKITLYRLDSKSRLAETLIRAVDNGKEVIVLMELRARFDEANNIEWSKRLEDAGCRVIYGLSDYKVHSKVCLITKRDFGRIHYITQIGTGNYNEKTVKQYTDLSLVTTNQEIGKDAAAFFNNLLLGNVGGEGYTHLWVAPGGFKKDILRYIDRERDKAVSGGEGRIIIKCNSLSDKEIILRLIEASGCGVKITMILRGICCLVPGIPGVTENITVISIVGRFLEHSRIFCFGSGDGKEVYISSGDLMTRNTERRIEVACPVLDIDIKQRICDMLEAMILDNTKAWEQFCDGSYVLRRAPADMVVDSQELFIAQAGKQPDSVNTEKRSNREKRGLKAFALQSAGRVRSLFGRKNSI